MTVATEVGVFQLARHTLRAPIPHELRGALGMAVLVLALFLLQVFTGILLSLYYQPSPETVADRMAASGMSSLREPPSSPLVTRSSVRTGSPDFALS